MEPLRRWRRGPRGLSYLAVCLSAAILLLTGDVLAGIHQHSRAEGSGHCALCSLASAHAAPTPLAPESPALSAQPATRLPAPCRVLGRTAPAQPGSRAPPLA